MITVLEDNFNRADGALGTAPTGQVWTSAAINGSVGISSNQMRTTSSNTGTKRASAPVGVLTYPISMKVIIPAGVANGSNRPAWWVMAKSDDTRGAGMQFLPGLNASMSATTGVAISAGTNVNFSVQQYVWIDISRSGSNETVSVYTNTSDTKPGSPTQTVTGAFVADTTSVHYLFDCVNVEQSFADYVSLQQSPTVIGPMPSFLRP